jgi:hypothetical protein
VLDRQNLARCEGASCQVRAKRLGKRAKEKLDELGVWHVFRRPGRRNQGDWKLSVASWWIESRYVLCASGLEVQGGQRPRGMMSSGRMTERHRIGCPQAGHRGTCLEVATRAGVSARPESGADGGSRCARCRPGWRWCAPASRCGELFEFLRRPVRSCGAKLVPVLRHQPAWPPAPAPGPSRPAGRSAARLPVPCRRCSIRAGRVRAGRAPPLPQIALAASGALPVRRIGLHARLDRGRRLSQPIVGQLV